MELGGGELFITVVVVIVDVTTITRATATVGV